MRAAKRFDVVEQVIHAATMRRTYPSGQANNDGYVRKLCRMPPSWDMLDMSEQFDIEHIRKVLVDATGPNGAFSQRGLSKAAGEGRDCVGDIINGRNKNPTVKVLSSLADALGGDLSMFGVAGESAGFPSRQALEQAFADALPGLPRGADRRAEYLAQVVLGVLELPRDQQEAERSVG